MYYKNPNNFYVANNIQNGKLINDFNDKFEELQTTDKKIFLLSLLQKDIDTTFLAVKEYNKSENGPTHKLDYGYSFHFYQHTTYAAPAGSSTTHKIVFTKPNEANIEILDTEFSTWAELGDYIIGDMFLVKEKTILLEKIQSLISNLQSRRLGEIKTVNDILSLNSNLSFIDFLYFSTITLTTTGYGDIVPNSTLVRKIVILQTIFGVMFIAFGLSLLTKK